MAEKELFGISEPLNCSDCVNHGGDWDCDHVHCRKGTDTISRQAAIDALGEEPLVWHEDDVGEVAERNQWRRDVAAIKALPSAQPGWIPCGERLPEEHEWIGTKKFGTTISNEVYVTFETPDGERFAKHISFQNGKLSPVDEQRMKVWFKGAKPIAWMPLPKPWEGR